MTKLIDALKGLRDEMGTYDSAGGNRSPNEFQIGRNSATAYWEDKLSEIIAEHERSAEPDPLALLQRTTKWIECFVYLATFPEDGLKLVNEANSVIAKAKGVA